MIALIDYGIGNLRSVEKALTAVGAVVRLTSNPETIQRADKVVLPGVGAFGDGMAGLEAAGLTDVLRRIAAQGMPLLGICLGMQLLFEGGEEYGDHAGLGLLPGHVQRFPTEGLKIPHTGWNRILPCQETPLLHGLQGGDYAYFNHSYYCDAGPDQTLAETDYGLRFPSVVGRGTLYGVQFHPEKSQNVGLAILRNFLERCG
jgi:glutamine amidotransferase